MGAESMTQTTWYKVLKTLISVNLVVVLIVLFQTINLSPDDAYDKSKSPRDERRSATQWPLQATTASATERQAATVLPYGEGVLLSPQHDVETSPLQMAESDRVAMTTTRRIDVNEALEVLDRLVLLLTQDRDKPEASTKPPTKPTASRLKQQEDKRTNAPTTTSTSTRAPPATTTTSTLATPTTTTTTTRATPTTTTTSKRVTPTTTTSTTRATSTTTTTTTRIIKTTPKREDAKPSNRTTRGILTNLVKTSTSPRSTSTTSKLTKTLAEAVGTTLPVRPHKRVLLWNPEFVHRSGAESLLKSFQKPGCQPYDCLLTLDRKLYSQADAVVVHFPMFISNETLLANELPKSRPRGQQWVFYSKESPARIKQFNYKLFDKMFNITLTYRLDSDVPIPYGKMHRMPDRWRQLRREAPHVNRATGKTKLVAWLVSNCRSEDTWRMEYAKELQKYVPVDIYGKCGNLSCPVGDRSACYKMLSKTYKFYLAFENSLCKDYVTEKLWNYRRGGLVPIVLGGYNYSSLPRKSVIDVTTFASVKDVADYIKQLDKNDYLYNKYFEWETDYQVVSGGSYCNLCEFLHKTPNHKKVYDLNNWWSYETTCVKPEVYFKGSADELIRHHVHGVTKPTSN